MRPKKHRTTGSGDLFRARLDQIINIKHELVQLAGKLDWDWIDGEIAPLDSARKLDCAAATCAPTGRRI
jgi:IS5 family transposase